MQGRRTRDEVLTLLETCPVIPAIKDHETWVQALCVENPIVFLLDTTLPDLPVQIESLYRKGKSVFLHLDRVEGLQTKAAAVDFLKDFPLTGILSTRESVLRRAKEQQFLTIQRFFVFDSFSLQSVEEFLQKPSADFLDVLPGLMPNLLRKFTQKGTPVLTGGLISQKEEIIAALKAGAMGISCTDPHIWKL